MFYLPSIHRDKEGPKDDIDSLLKHINLVNIKEWGTKYIYWVQMAQSFKTAMKFSFETFSWLTALSLLNLSHLSCNTNVKCHISTSLLVAQSLIQQHLVHLAQFLCFPKSPISASLLNICLLVFSCFVLEVSKHYWEAIWIQFPSTGLNQWRSFSTQIMLMKSRAQLWQK